ncbi:MAG: insulinase family protein, partial [Rhodospirillales bacterium]|nr:insulinase family protein [Rhodospirillales bacterium]
HEQVVALAKKYLEPIPRQAPPPPVRTVEPPQLGERRIVIKRPAQLPLLLVSYHVPATKHADNAALDMLNRLVQATGDDGTGRYRGFVDLGDARPDEKTAGNGANGKRREPDERR